MKSLSPLSVLQTLTGTALLLIASSAAAQNDAETATIRAANERLVKAFNAGKADELAAMFHPQGELIDEEGLVYQGRTAIQDLLSKYFAKFPGAKLKLDVDSIRIIGPVAFEEGTRTTTTKDETGVAQVHYTKVRAKVGNDWLIVSLQDSADDADLTPHDRLEALAWLIGEWVNEGSDAAVRVSYRWSDDKNFILGDFHVGRAGSTVMQSTQRIGWDPLAGKVRSWLFDSDGGFGEGHWTHVDGSWVIKSSAVLPDGQTGSATVTMTPQSKDRYLLKGTDRISGDERAEDFEFTVTRRPPMPGK
ncbi:MAG TPA: SgcJ/EcaC family oxidoreductase [Pirellulaceae bacterium]|jgi:uncharacterized protein (TIGR02246 family)